MRTPPLNELLTGKGASFEERRGISIPLSVSSREQEYKTIRDGVGITDFSFMQKFRISADDGVDALDELFAGNVARIRFCRVLHTFLADADGNLVADCYVANNDDDFIVLCESIVDDEALEALLFNDETRECGLENITEDYVTISIDGYQAWAVAKDLFGADILGLPYLSIEVYPFEGTEINLFRAGKTSEFGYMVMAPKEVGAALMEALLASAEKHDGGLCGLEIHNDLRLEGRFFNIFAEGATVRDPLSLGLQWMIDLDKEAYLGRDPIMARREAGLEKKIIGVKTAADATGFEPGTALYDGAEAVAELQAACLSRVLDAQVGLALFPVELAYTGLSFNLGSPDGPVVETISMPPIIPRSLSVKLDEM